MGHRLPDHDGPCRFLHGHRYVAEIAVEGDVQGSGAQRGMVVDFAAIKAAVRSIIADGYDHRFLVSMADPLWSQMEYLPGVIGVSWVPTAENLAMELRRALSQLAQLDGARIGFVRVHETPECWAEAR